MKTFLCYFTLFIVLFETVWAQAYIGGAYDFGQNRYGERRGDLGPAAIAGVVIGAVAVLMALMVTIYFCYNAAQNSGDLEDQYSNTKYRPAPQHR